MAAKAEKKVVPRPKKPKLTPTFIKQWRDHRDLTQDQLAERVTTYMRERGAKKGYTYASIGRLERGLHPYNQLVLEAVADALGTDPASLLMRDPADPSGIWSVWDRALPAERQLIAEQAESVVRNRRKAS